MHELRKSKKKKRPDLNKEEEDQLSGSYCQPDEQFSNGHEDVVLKGKKKKKRKAALESALNDDTLAVSETNSLLNVDELKEEPNSIGLQEVTRKDKKKKRKKHTIQEEISDETCDPKFPSNGDDNHGMLVHEEVTRKAKKKKKKHTYGEEEASVKEEIEKETCDQRDDNEEMMVLEQERTKKSKKRKAIGESEKLVNSFESHSQNNGSNGGPDVKKKKKVSWRENISESKDPEIFKDIEATHPPPVMNAILSLLSDVNNTSDQVHLHDASLLRWRKHCVHFWEEIPPNSSRKRSAKNKYEARLQTLAIKKERRKALRKSKIETRKMLKAEAKGQKSIEDCNIKNKNKLTENGEELVGSCEMKRPRLDVGISSGPTRKRSRSITPDREVISGHKWKDLTDQQRENFNKKKEQRRLDKLSVPKLILLNNGNLSSLRLEDEERTPLMLNDIQHFLIYSLHSHHTPGSIPTWVNLKFSSKISKVVCVVVDGASMSDYLLHEDQLPTLKSFQFQLEVITPYAYGGDFAKEFWTVPLSRTQRAKLIRRYGSLEKANLEGEAFESVKKLYPIDTFKTSEIVLHRTGVVNGIVKKTTKVFDNSLKDYIGIRDTFPRTELLLRSWDLLRESVPVPFATGYLAKKYEGFVKTKDRYLPVTDHSPIWAVDCEMCETCQGSELTRISVINEDFEVVYESLVKPHNPITNYLTQYSGITPELLENEWTRLEDVQNDLRSILPADVILAGHSVGNDLLAMKMFHPYVIDSSVCFNFSGVRGRKTKLKTLVAELLYERIQDGGKDGHDSVEDAASCLKLIKAKLARYFEWGDAVLGGKRSEHDSAVAQQQLLIRKEENKKKMVYPVAENAIIRSGPRAFKSIKEGKPSKTPKTPARVESFKPPAVTAFPTPPAQDCSSLNKPEDTKQWSKSLVTNLFAYGKKSLLVVGRGEFMKNGKELTNAKTKKSIRSDPRCVFAVQEDSKVLTYGCDNAPSNGISILRLDISMLKGNSKLQEVDAMIGKAVKNVKENVLFTVLLPGRFQPEEKHPNHGIFMMKIFKPPFVPLTIEDIS